MLLAPRVLAFPRDHARITTSHRRWYLTGWLEMPLRYVAKDARCSDQVTFSYYTAIDPANPGRFAAHSAAGHAARPIRRAAR